MIKVKRVSKILIITSVILLFIPLTTQGIFAQAFEKTTIADTIEDLTGLMENSFDLDDNVKNVWLDYVELLNKAEFQDYTKEDASNTGSSYEEIKEFYSPDASEIELVFGEYEKEYIYSYESENLEELSIHLYFYRGY